MKIKNTDGAQPLLEFNNARFHYVYSYLLDTRDHQPKKFLALLEQLGWSRGIPWSRRGWLPTHATTTVVNNQAFKYLDLELANDAGGDELDKALLRSPLMSAVKANGSPIIKNGKLDCRIGRMLRFRSNGSGCLTITIDVRHSNGEPLTFYELEPFIRLVPRTWIQRDFDVATADEIERTETGFLTKLILAEPRSQEERDRSWSLDDLFCDGLEHLEPLKMGLAFPQITQDGDDARLANALKGRQIPYLFIDAEVTSRVFSYYFQETSENHTSVTRRRTEIVKHLAALLMHFFNLDQFDAISLDYIKSEFGLSGASHPSFSSMNANSEVFTYLHKTAALALCGDRRHGASTFVLPSMIDIAEACRIRWHTLMIANLALDYLLAEVPKASLQEIDYLIVSLENFRRAIGMQMWDPHLYLHDGHVGFDISGGLQRSFRFEAMQEALTQKLDLLDTLIRRRDLIQAIDRVAERTEESEDVDSSQKDFDPLEGIREDFP